jgi:RNA ligase (TIGR02306 family)
LSELSVKISRIASAVDHPNADRLSIVQVDGWHCITSKTPTGLHRFGVGGECIYIPIDSVLPDKLETILFPPGSKVTLSKSRVKTAKIRGVYSQGMVIAIDPELLAFYPDLAGKRAGDDVTAILGISKYEPPAPEFWKGMKQVKHHPLVGKFCDLEHIEKHPNVFSEGDLVNVSEKLHGCNALLAKVPRRETNLFWGILQKIGIYTRYEIVTSSRNCHVENTGNLYGDTFTRQKLADKLLPGEILAGEIVGPGIQKNYTYGFSVPTFLAFDIKKNGKYLTPREFFDICKERSIETVPCLADNVKFSAELIEKLRQGPSALGDQPIKEGIVLRSSGEESTPFLPRKILRAINKEYLLQKGNTEFH